MSGTETSTRISFEFTFNGKPVTAYSGDSIASALVRSGLHVFSRSMKYHRPRGLFCGAGRCFSCAMRVNGVPGVRTCSTRAEQGMVVETEGGFPSVRHDALSVFDHIFRKEFDYQTKFIRPRAFVPMYQKLVRRLASPRKLPDRQIAYHPLEELTTNVLIVGHGISGTAATDRLRSLGQNPLVVDRHGTDVFPPSIAFGFYEDGRVGVLSETGGLIVRAKKVLLATGRVESGVDVVNADLPGVMLPEAVRHLVMRGVSPGKRVFIVGRNELTDRAIEELREKGAEVVGRCDDPDEIVRLVGRDHVKRVEHRLGDRKRSRVPCDAVILMGPLVPYIALAQQAGCELLSSNGLWTVKSDDAGRTSSSGVFACGSVSGYIDPEDRRLSGMRSADAIAGSLEVR